ncbi:DMT family transporter [Vibrio sp.]|nr:DMT family transporter [Vibrio sp.]
MNTLMMNLKKNDKAVGFLIAFLGAFLMSIDPIFIRYAGVSGFDTAFLFGLFSAISMPILLVITDKRGITQAIVQSGWPLLIAGILMVGSASGLVFSIKHTSIANTFMILSAAPAFAAIFSWFFLREKTNKSTVMTIIAVMFGVGIIVSDSVGGGDVFGNVLAIFSVICFSLMFTLLRKYPNVSRLGSVAVGGALLAITMVFFAEPSEYDNNTWVMMGIMGLFSAPLGRVMSMVATRYITAAEVSMTLMLETVLATLWGMIFFSEIPTTLTMVGGLFILISLFMYSYHNMKNNV